LAVVVLVVVVLVVVVVVVLPIVLVLRIVVVVVVVVVVVQSIYLPVLSALLEPLYVVPWEDGSPGLVLLLSPSQE